jgi:uncharacterized protein (TIGR03118 family)
MQLKRSLTLVTALAIATLTGGISSAAQTKYLQTNLVADTAAFHAVTTDPNLVNAWGIAAFPGNPFWINDNGTGLSTLYDGLGDIVNLVVTVPLPPASSAVNSSPTGMVANGTTSFDIPTTALPGLFIFDSEDGTVSAWNPGANATNAITTVDNSGTGAVYKGLAMATNANGTFLYATNFNSGKIDVLNGTFTPVTLSGSFTDSTLPPGYAPFGISLINGSLFVSYALQNSAKHDDVAGKGHGYVDIFDTNGNLVRRFASKGNLNSPWGITQATFNFGQFSDALLVGNFGDGRINAFDPISGKSLGQLHDANGKPITIDGLWALTFGGGAAGTDPDTLYFTAGPDGEQHGLYGSLAAQ